MTREERAKKLIPEKFRLIGVFASSAGDTITETEAVIAIKGMLKDIESMQCIVSGEYPAVISEEMKEEPAGIRQLCQIVEEYDDSAPEPFGWQSFPIDKVPGPGETFMLKWLDGREAYQVKVMRKDGNCLWVKAIPKSQAI